MESVFQFTNPVLSDLEFRLNKGFDNSSNEEIKIKTKMTIHVSRQDSEREAIVSLTCLVGEKDDSSPFFIEATERANFRWDNSMDNIVDKLLNQNAPSLLLSYLRTIIAQITSESPYDAYHIPFINFTKNIK